jgi:transposase
LEPNYRRIKTRLGPSKAVTPTAQKLTRIFYHMLRYRTDYVDPGFQYYEQKYQQRVLNNLKRKARLLGYELIQGHELRAAAS